MYNNKLLTRTYTGTYTEIFLNACCTHKNCRFGEVSFLAPVYKSSRISATQQPIRNKFGTNRKRSVSAKSAKQLEIFCADLWSFSAWTVTYIYIYIYVFYIYIYTFVRRARAVHARATRKRRTGRLRFNGQYNRLKNGYFSSKL